ncbi:MAG: DUF3307 domain-containing protein [Deltaproteobacteria bacterium]|nr:MAG: DUF3307 domain-containing protein [Deltaproteobacteria bacterium]
MTIIIFVLLLVSHFLGDIVFTSYRLAILKRDSGLIHQIVAIGGHSSVHAVCAGVLLFVFNLDWLKGALLVLALHFVIDFIRCRTEIRLYGPGRLFVKRSELFAWISGKSGNPEKMTISKLWPWILIHVLDQGAHLASLYGIAVLI